jgi:hypothetical protein
MGFGVSGKDRFMQALVKSRARRLAKTVALGLVVCAVLCFAWCLYSSRPATRVTRANYEAIESGMAKADVITLLNCNPHYAPGEWREPSVGGSLLSMHIEQTGHLWVSSECRIWVVFNDEGKVTSKMLSTGGEDSLFQKVCRSIGIP